MGAALLLLVACNRPPAAPTPVVTFNKDIAPILFENCASCHRPARSAGSAPVDPNDPLCIAGAPFSLLDYASAHAHADEIAQATLTRAMPPWLPEPGHGEFLNTRRLSDQQVNLIQQWARQGAPRGETTSEPTPPTFPNGWQLGTPDLVVTSADAYTLKAGKDDVFRTLVFPVPSSPARY